jgi:hypothetical protein
MPPTTPPPRTRKTNDLTSDKPHLQWLTDDVKSGAKRLSRRVLSVALAILPINRA